MSPVKLIKNLKLGPKLMLTFVTLGLLACALVGVTSALGSKAALQKQALEQLKSIRDLKSANLARFFNQKRANLAVLARSPDVAEAVGKFDEFNSFMGFNENGTMLVDSDVYREIYAEVDPALRFFNDAYNFDDTLLISRENGMVLYSSAQGAELGANLEQGAMASSRESLSGSPLEIAWSKAVQNGRLSFADFASYTAIGGEPAAFIAVPVGDGEGEFNALIAARIPSAILNEIMHERSGMGETGKTFLVGQDGLMRSDSYHHKDEWSVARSFSGNNHVESSDYEAAIKGETGEGFATDYVGTRVCSAYNPIDVFDTKWALLAQIDVSEAFAPVSGVVTKIVLYTVLAVVLIGIATFFVSMTISRPVAMLAAEARQMAEGDFSREIRQIAQTDEIGELNHAFQRMQEGISELVSMTSEAASHVAEASAELAENSEQTANVTREVAQTVDEVAKGSQNTAQQVELAHEKMGNSTSAIQSVASDAEQAATLSGQANQMAGEGMQAANEAVDKINGVTDTVNDAAAVVDTLGDKSRRIGEIVDLITTIAGQTNLLALNAAIEAARAGDAGRGFAVVAEEVRKLAEESSGAAENIASIIGEVQSEMDRALEAMNRGRDEVTQGQQIVLKTGETLKGILVAVETTSEKVENISASSEELLATSGELSEAMQTIASISEESAAGAQQATSSTEQQSSAVREVNEASTRLSGMAKDLQDLVGKFRVRS